MSISSRAASPKGARQGPDEPQTRGFGLAFAAGKAPMQRNRETRPHVSGGGSATPRTGPRGHGGRRGTRLVQRAPEAPRERHRRCIVVVVAQPPSGWHSRLREARRRSSPEVSAPGEATRERDAQASPTRRTHHRPAALVSSLMAHRLLRDAPADRRKLSTGSVVLASAPAGAGNVLHSVRLRPGAAR